jgi:hypothetical protein
MVNQKTPRESGSSVNNTAGLGSSPFTGRLVVYGLVTLFVAIILDSYNRRLATFYVLVVLFAAILRYSEQFFASINFFLSAVQSITSSRLPGVRR